MNVTPPATVTLTGQSDHTTLRTRQEDVAQEFEAVLLSKFVDEMMKTVSVGTFGNKQQAEIWRSFLSDAVADQIAQSGGLGLEPQIKDAIGAYRQVMQAK
ncbi:rod-binding protein [Roseovarius indicus]|uniref:Chemotactic signal-response protein CheL n=1 Tax=Roseovarius indicus TaxID=540747 RepID=A0A5P3AAJ9_9RHOB|nr:rod-binding protein [Roseovarius indicus]QEW25600.1 chemotactic signal-response protein CheL [Roseovarius indicus]SFE02172.1 Rod binding protein [Roseovarius indicus]